MVILHIASLSDKKFIGPNINVPANVIYSEKYAKTGLYNSNKINYDEYKKQIKDYFEKDDMKRYDIKTLPEPYNNPDLVVFHSANILSHVLIAKKLRKYDIPYVIVPRGALTTQAQNKKRLKKKIFNILFLNKYIKKALGIQFLTENEYEESRHFKFQKYIISGNGTTHKDVTKQYDNVDYSKYIVTFIGRISNYHKGLDVLIDAVDLGKEEFRKLGIEVNLYGPDRDNSLEYLQCKIEEYKIKDIVKLKPEVYDKEKEKTLMNADLFIHTSRLEGQPTSIIEAISYGVPVLVTPGTNMAEEVKKNNLGFVAELNPESIKQQIINSYKGRNEFPKITENELKYSKENFEWSKIMKETIDKYQNLLESRKK